MVILKEPDSLGFRSRGCLLSGEEERCEKGEEAAESVVEASLCDKGWCTPFHF